MFGNAMNNLNGTILTASNRVSNCGSVLNVYSFGNVFFGGIDYGGVATQSTNKTLVIEEKSCRRLNADYSIDTTGFTAGYALPAVNAGFTTGIALGENDKYYICGIITGWTYYTGGTVVSPSTNIIRFDANGIVDTTYSGNSLGVTGSGIGDDPYMFNDYNGKVIITSITSWNGDTTRKGIIRLNANGTLDTSFTSTAFSGVAGTTVITALPLPDGKYLVGGSFTNLLGISTQDYLVRLNADGTLDTTFVNGGAAYLQVKDIDIQSSGKIIVFGRQRVFRLNADGSLDSSFTIGVLNTATDFGSLSVSPSDTIIVGSNFLTYNGQSYRDLVKLDRNGNLNMCPEPSATPTPTITPTMTSTPTGTISLTPTTTSTPTNTPSSTPPEETCTVWQIYNGSFFEISWSGILCGTETSTGGTVAIGQTIYTPCIKDGTLGYTGSPTITVDAIC